MIEIDDDLHLKLIDGSFDKIDEQTINELKDLSILVNDDNSLLNKLKYEIYKSRYDRNSLHLTITPTYFCNFNCLYCYEKNRPPVFMSKATEKNLISFVKEKKINTLQVTWYGGEPLLAFDKMISLTAEFKKIVRTFSAHIVTNGYLLTPDKIKLLKYLNIDEIQITLDGPPEIHNKTRPLHNGKETYSVIIENINNVLSETDIQINVRANIDKNNARFFHSFQDHLLNSKFKGRNIFIYPSIVYDFDDISSCQSSSGCLLNKNDYSKFLVEQFYVKKNINLNYFPSAPDIECMAKHINAFLIGADGDIYKCWVDIGNKGKRIGNINDPSIKNYDILAQYMVEMDVFEDSKCRECILLPSCLGGCPNERIKSATNEDIDYCSPMVNNLKSFLEIQYLIDSNNQSKINK